MSQQTGISMDGTPVPVALLNGWFFTAVAKGAMRGMPGMHGVNMGAPGGIFQGIARYLAALRDIIPLSDGYLNPLDLFPDPQNGQDSGVAVIVLNSLSTPLTLLGMYKDDGMSDAGASQTSYPATVYTNGKTKAPHTIPGIHGYPTPSAHPLFKTGFGSDLMAGIGIYRFHCPTNSISVDKDLGMGFALAFSCNAEDYPDVGLAFKKSRQFYETTTWADGEQIAMLSPFVDPKDSWQPTNINVSSHTWRMASKVSADISKVTGLVDPRNPSATLATGVNLDDQLKKLHSRLNNRWMQGTAGGPGHQITAYSPIPNYPNAAENNFCESVTLKDGRTLFIWGTISSNSAQPSMNVITIWVGDTKSWLNDIQGEMPGYHWGKTPRRTDQGVPPLLWVDFGLAGKKIGTFFSDAGKWVERHTDGQGIYSFQTDTTRSNRSSVYLNDSSRNVTIHIDLARSKIRYSDANNAEYDLYDILALRPMPE